MANWITVLRSRGALVVGLIMLVWAVGYLPGIGARDLRLEEGRRATPAREMIASGDYVVPTLYGERYLSKPPGFFWVVAAVGSLRGGVDELAVRIPSVLSVLFGAWLLLGVKGMSREARVLAALLFMSMPIMLDKGTLGEIDALLSMVTFAAVVAWWRALDWERGRVAMWGWLAAGLVLGASILMKGPGGLAEFYAVIIGGLLFARIAPNGHAALPPWRVLLSTGHALMLLLALAPVAIWIWTLLARTGMTWRELAGIWAHQTGADVVAGKGGGKFARLLVDHYVMFPVKALSDVMPWVLLGIAGTFGRKPGNRIPSEDDRTQHFFTFGWIMLLFLFWLWPKANPRYMMMGAYPVAIAAAIAIARWDLARSPKLGGFFRSAALLMAFAVGVVGGAAIMLAINLHSPALLSTCLAAAASFVLAVLSMWLTKRTPIEGLGVAFACNLALVIVLGWGMMTSVLLPQKAKTDATRIVHEQINTIIPPGVPVYTTRTFSKNADCYNEQFYIPGGAKALNTGKFPPNFIAIMTVDEWQSNDKDAFRLYFPHARELGRLDARKKGGPTPMVVVEVENR